MVARRSGALPRRNHRRTGERSAGPYEAAARREFRQAYRACVGQLTRMKDVVRVSWVFDVISPFAYLGFPRLSRLPARVSLEFVPVLFAGLLQHFGQLGPAEIPSKRRFTYRFALWRARQLGLPMRMPPAHPFNPLAALRLIIAAGSDQRAAGTVLDAVYREGRDVADPGVIAELARELGVADPQTALADTTIKQRLRDNTNWASSRGIFGSDAR